MPRLPSFQQLNETLNDPDISNGPTAKNILSYSSAFKNLALYQESKSMNANANANVNANANGNKVINKGCVTNPYSLGPGYSYGNTIYGRHESYPSHYYSLGPDVYRQKQDSTSPTSLDGMNMSKSNSNDIPHESFEDYTFISDLVQFLTSFELKCRENNVLKYHNFDNFGNGISNALNSMNNVDIEGVLNKFKKITRLLEGVQFSKNSKQCGQEIDNVAGNMALKRGLSQPSLLGLDRKKKQKRAAHQSISFPTGSRISPFEVSMPTNDSNTFGHDRQGHNSVCMGVVGGGGTGAGVGVGVGGLNSDLTLKADIVCQHCCSHETPEWRRGPEGSRTLCNACGLFYSKLIKKYGLHEADRVMLERKQTGTVNDRRIF
ncbi:hypothetical protein KGF56_004430 [Candida oxycetoniae]|uniref:GATA-type domain-containing protein n=1 Tax=Candida oxycetoniae TaxID=497107 RepID=A0AAI9STV1_9ASCO|nr:uncharacterized protein KGF56_004430 [Candida oxycetoniae]KAI3402756.2 hypothetical protein KGF56_004430 [Candida oxycetoniae]